MRERELRAIRGPLEFPRFSTRKSRRERNNFGSNLDEYTSRLSAAAITN